MIKDVKKYKVSNCAHVKRHSLNIKSWATYKNIL